MNVCGKLFVPVEFESAQFEEEFVFLEEKVEKFAPQMTRHRVVFAALRVAQTPEGVK